MSVSSFMRRHYRHFNAAVVVDASDAWIDLLDRGGSMMVTLAGAMSTAELGVSLAEMIRQEKVHAITCTGANLEEDVFNLVARDHYVRLPNWRDLTPEDEEALRERGLNRVTDTCIPEDHAFRVLESHLRRVWEQAASEGQRYFPHEYFYQLLRSGALETSYQIDPRDSWMVAAAERNLPIFVPGWEDSTCGNVFVANVMSGRLPRIDLVRSGLEYMARLIDWYRATASTRTIGLFQIGGGIAGDFPICVVPLIRQDLQEEVPLWSYFCQISDSTTSYGSYSGAVPNEKITWEKVGIETPRFIIESDASIVAPLVFAQVLGW